MLLALVPLVHGKLSLLDNESSVFSKQGTHTYSLDVFHVEICVRMVRFECLNVLFVRY